MDTVRRVELTRISTTSSMDPTTAGVCLGLLFGGVHLLWAALVAVGWAQPLMDFMFKLHFIQPVYVITKFDFGAAGLLVLITTLSGFVFGYVFATLWNRFAFPRVEM